MQKAQLLTGLLDYLYGTLSISNMRWIGEHLIEHANMKELEQLRPYTMKEIDEMLDDAEAAFDAGDFLTNDEVFHHKKTVTFNFRKLNLNYSYYSNLFQKKNPWH